MITLAQKIEDVKTLLARLEKGWREKNIFEDEGYEENERCEYNYPNNNREDYSGQVNEGWATILYHLTDLLGFDQVGLDENGHRHHCIQEFDEQAIRTLMWNASAFIKLMTTPN